MAYPQHQAHNAGAAPTYPASQNVSPGGIFQHPQQQQQQQQPQGHDYYSQPQGFYQEHDRWDEKSTKSYNSAYAGSQVHLNPGPQEYPPVPTMPYQASYPPQNYPPEQQHRPQMLRAPGSNSGYSDAREKLMKRRSVRQVELQGGNLVLDMQVPSHIVPAGQNHSEEMTKLRYTAATCDPDDFMRSRYSLRPYLNGRHTELFIVMTMYNEDEVLFCRTMNA